MGKQSAHPATAVSDMLLAGAAACLPAAVLGANINPGVMHGALVNPDSAMRIVRLHDILAAGAPLHAVMRDGSGQGTVLHWSHLLDTLLIALGAPLAAVAGWPAALQAVGIVFGPITLVALGMAVAWAAMPLSGRGWAWLGAMAAGAMPTISGYGLPGVVHHHILLAICAVMSGGWALRLLLGARGRPAGMALGAWAGAGLWLSPESLLVALMALGAVWAAWLQTGRRPLGTALAAAGLTFLATALAAWIVDPPADPWTVSEPDRISLPFVLLAAAAAAAGLCARGRPGASWPARLSVAAASAAGAAAWLLAFPHIRQGTEGLMPPEAAAAFFTHIEEMQPIRTADDVLSHLLGGLLAAGATLLLAVRRPGLATAHAALCAAALVALAAAHVRFAPYAGLAGAVVLPIALARISRSALIPPLQSVARLALILPLLLAPLLPPISAIAAAPGAASAKPAVCPIDGVGPLLAGHPGQTVLAGVNQTPDLLLRAPVQTVGSLYHRNPQGFMRLRAAWRSTPGDTPPPELLTTGATLVLGCPHEARSSLLEGAGRNTLADRLIADAPPPWLHRIADAGPGGYVLYRVAPTPAPPRSGPPASPPPSAETP